MRPCPSCRTSLRVFRTGGVELDACPGCRGLWFDGGELGPIVTPRAIRDLLASARGRPGRCKGCGRRLENVSACPDCKAAAPACPECGLAPLSLGTVRGVELDVCPRCSGIWLDQGELVQLAGEQGRVASLLQAALAAGAIEESPSRTVCNDCRRELRRSHAFEDSGGRFYCGSCAPTGSAPVVAELTPPDHEDEDEEEEGWRVGNGSRRSAGWGGAGHAEGLDVLSLLRTLFR